MYKINKMHKDNITTSNTSLQQVFKHMPNTITPYRKYRTQHSKYCLVTKKYRIRIISLIEQKINNNIENQMNMYQLRIPTNRVYSTQHKQTIETRKIILIRK